MSMRMYVWSLWYSPFSKLSLKMDPQTRRTLNPIFPRFFKGQEAWVMAWAMGDAHGTMAMAKNN